MIRAFIAVGVDEAVRRRLGQFQDACRRTGAKVTWVSPQNMHVSLVFLGGVSEDTSRSIAAALDAEGARTAPFPLRLAGTGTFGKRRAPRVVWAGVTEGSDHVRELQARAAAAARAAGIAMDDRPYTPHLTVGRVRGRPGGEELARTVAEWRDADFGRSEVRTVLLVQSVLTPRGPVYTILHASALNAAAGTSAA